MQVFKNISVLCCFSVALMDTKSKRSNLEKKRLMLLDHKITKPLLRKPKSRVQAVPETDTMEECCLLSYSLAHDQLVFWCSPGPSCLGIVPPIVSSPILSSLKIISHSYGHKSMRSRQLGVPFSQVTLECVKWKIKTKHPT